MRRRWILSLSVALLYGFPVSAQEQEALLTMPLSGTDWRIHEDAEGKGVENRLFEAEISASDWNPATLEFQVPAADLRPGRNTLEVRVQADGWFSWDAMDLISSQEGEVSEE